MKYLTTILLLLFYIIGFSQTDARLAGIEKDMNAILKATDAPSFAVAIVEKDRIVYAKGFGHSDLEQNKLADANTLYAIGSSTKAFTSTILGQLREDKLLSFEDSPRKYLPELEFYNDDLNNQVIIKDLMRHTTGIPRHDLSWYLFPTDSSDSLMQRIKFLEPFTGIRQQWYYNNFMFLTQGEIAHKLTNKSWGDNIKERFFKPLNMQRSSVGIDGLLEQKNRAIGYNTIENGENEKMDYYRIAGMRAAGSINSSVHEMSNWLIAWINNGKFQDQQIIPKTYRKEAITPSAVVDQGMTARLMMLEDDPSLQMVNYGYGWFVSNYHGHYQVEHGGNIDGFSASVVFYPKDSIGIVILTNQNGSLIPLIARNTIADRMLGLEKISWIDRYKAFKEKTEKAQAAAKSQEDAAQVKNTKPSHNLVEYTGSYALDGYGNFEVYLKNDSLFADFNRMKTWLKHYHYDVFVPCPIKDGKIDTNDNMLNQFKFNFTSNLTGDIASANIIVEPTLPTPKAFKRTPKNISVDKDQLSAYEGEYEVGGMTINVHVEETVLFVFVPGQTDYELLATGKHEFSLKGLDGYKVAFLENEEGTINAVNFIQPNGTFKATKK